METLTTKAEIVNELEETRIFCGPDDSKDTPRPENGGKTETVDPNNGGGNNGETKEGEERPGGF